MEDFLQSLVQNTQGFGAYLTVFSILIACGLGVPLPEDISLILGGVLVHRGGAELPWMMLVAMVGILAGDSLIFAAGRRLGAHLGTQPGGLLGRVVTLEKLQKAAVLFEKYGDRIVMIARFMPGVRAVTYFAAGSSGMKYWRFILFDGIAALVSAPVFVYLGYFFGDELQKLINGLRQGQKGVFLGLGIAIAAYLLFRYFKHRRATVSPAPTPRADSQ